MTDYADLRPLPVPRPGTAQHTATTEPAGPTGHCLHNRHPTCPHGPPGYALTGGGRYVCPCPCHDGGGQGALFGGTA